MTRHFDSLGAFAMHLAEVAIAERFALEKGLDAAAELVENAARAKMGEYQGAVGAFPQWEQLAESTQEERERLGFTPNDPLLRSGELRDSFGRAREGLEAVAGAASDIMPYQEFGTSKIPPRPVWGPAAIENREKIERLIGAAAVSGIIGGESIHASLGYDFETEKLRDKP